MVTLSFLNQTIWCDPHWNRVSETIPMSGNIIGFGWEIRKLAIWKLSILDLICCPESIIILIIHALMETLIMLHYAMSFQKVFQLWRNSGWSRPLGTRRVSRLLTSWMQSHQGRMASQLTTNLIYPIWRYSETSCYKPCGVIVRAASLNDRFVPADLQPPWGQELTSSRGQMFFHVWESFRTSLQNVGGSTQCQHVPYLFI